MPVPLTRLQLNRLNCEVPGCTHADHRVLFVEQLCHTKAGLMVTYDRIAGTLTCYCKACLEPVVTIVVAEGVRQ
jgi:hypothetical protein